MIYRINTETRHKDGVRQVEKAIKQIQRLYPDADANQILWGFAHATACAHLDTWVENYLPGFAEASGFHRANAT